MVHTNFYRFTQAQLLSDRKINITHENDVLSTQTHTAGHIITVDRQTINTLNPKINNNRATQKQHSFAIKFAM
jgi:hypothetical protein